MTKVTTWSATTGWSGERVMSTTSDPFEFGYYTPQPAAPIVIREHVEIKAPEVTRVVRCAHCSAVCDEKTALKVGTCRNCGSPFPTLPSEVVVDTVQLSQVAALEHMKVQKMMQGVMMRSTVDDLLNEKIEAVPDVDDGIPSFILAAKIIAALVIAALLLYYLG